MYCTYFRIIVSEEDGDRIIAQDVRPKGAMQAKLLSLDHSPQVAANIPESGANQSLRDGANLELSTTAGNPPVGATNVRSHAS